MRDPYVSNGTPPVELAQAAFPVENASEHRVCRRGFLQLVCAASAGCAATAVMGAGMEKTATREEAFAVCAEGALAIGESLVGIGPVSGRPCLLIHLSEGKYAAYDQRCTHLLCPVHYDREQQRLICPCHHGAFDAESGQPVAGPPKRPLERYDAFVRGGNVWVRRA